MKKTSENNFSVKLLLDIAISLCLHVVLFVLTYAAFWGSYSSITLEKLSDLPLDMQRQTGSLLLILSLLLSLVFVFAQLLSHVSQLRIYPVYVIVFFVAFVPLCLFLDVGIVSVICVLSGISLLLGDRFKYFYLFFGILLILIGFFWSLESGLWAMAVGIPTSLWYLDNRELINYLPQIVVMSVLLIGALIFQETQYGSKESVDYRFDKEKIDSQVPQWLLDEHLLESGWTRNDLYLWVEGFTPNKRHFSTASIKDIQSFLLHYDTKLSQPNSFEHWHFVVIQLILFFLWWLFLDNKELSPLRLLSYWGVVFGVWAWMTFLRSDQSQNFLLGFYAFGGILPLIKAKDFRDFLVFDVLRKVALSLLLFLMVLGVAWSLTINIFHSLQNKTRYEQSRAILKQINADDNYFSMAYIDWQSELMKNTCVPFRKGLDKPSALYKSEDDSFLELGTEATFYYILPRQNSKMQIDLLITYHSEHQQIYTEWKKISQTKYFEIWTNATTTTD